MFDLLPPSAAPDDVELASELQFAKEQCQTVFRGLPKSLERDSVLNALGRMGKASLKHKVRHRANYILDAVGDRFPQLTWVLEVAIDCRNHFVHGTALKFQLGGRSDPEGFLTDTLEFVFAASEFVEAGWNIGDFMKTPTSMSHPFGAYRVNYLAGLQALKTLTATP